METDPVTGLYSEEELTKRAYFLLEKKGLMRDKKATIVQPAVQPVNRTTVYLNFPLFCSEVNRSKEHVFAYLQREIGVSCTMNHLHQVVFKKRVKVDRLRRNLLNYAQKYVFCSSCRSKDTTVQKRIRIEFLDCNNCHTSTAIDS